MGQRVGLCSHMISAACTQHVDGMMTITCKVRGWHGSKVHSILTCLKKCIICLKQMSWMNKLRRWKDRQGIYLYYTLNHATLLLYVYIKCGPPRANLSLFAIMWKQGIMASIWHIGCSVWHTSFREDICSGSTCSVC